MPDKDAEEEDKASGEADAKQEGEEPAVTAETTAATENHTAKDVQARWESLGGAAANRPHGTCASSVASGLSASCFVMTFLDLPTSQGHASTKTMATKDGKAPVKATRC